MTDEVGPTDEVEPPLLSDRGLLVLLAVDGLLLGLVGLAYSPLYLGGIPVPLGVVASVVGLPWLVARAAELDQRPAVAGAPLSAFGITVGVLGLAGPGGDVLLPATWQSLLLVFGGLGVGALALRRALDRQYDKERSHG